jgi:dipeptidyl aminopeptidase/acylaminoacyl peptidase
MSHRLTVICLAALTFSTAPAVRTAERSWTPDLMLKVKRLGPVVPSPDGSRVAFLVSEAVMDGEKSEWLSQIHVAASDGSGTFQLTRGEKPAISPRWSPDGQSIAFLSPRTGDKAGVFIISVAGGEADQVTSEKESISSFAWAPDGQSIAFVMPEPKSAEEEKAAKEKHDARVIDENYKLAGLYTVPVAKNAEGKRPSRRR